jgi:heptosyltransferase-2
MNKRILIRGVNWLGDAVMTMPAIRAVRRAHPDAHIALAVKPLVAELFRSDPNIDEIIPIHGLWDTASCIRAKRFDTAILLPNSMSAALLSFLARIPERIGYRRDGRGALLTKGVPYSGEDRSMHHIDYYLRMLVEARVIDGPPTDTDPWLYLTIAERETARATLSALPAPVIGVNPGAAFGSAKQWLPERFAEVITRVVNEANGSVVLFGGPNELDIADAIIAACNPMHLDSGRIMNLAGKTTVRELCALVSACDVLLSNDSGPMHLGIAAKTPLVAIFGSTSPELTGPRGTGSIVLRPDLSCSPCFKRTCPHGHLRCMHEITPAQAFDAITSLIPRKRAAFFDRDGTLCHDAHYLNSWDEFRLLDGVGDLARLRDAGLELIGVSNQSGIGRGIVSKDFVGEVHDLFMREHGFSAFYHCPHRPDACAAHS